MSRRISTATAVTVGTSFTTVLTIVMGGRERQLNLEVENTGGSNALTDVQIQCRDHPGGEWYSEFAASEIEEFGGLKTLAHSSIAHAKINVAGMDAVRLQAKVGASTTTVAARGVVSELAGGEEEIEGLNAGSYYHVRDAAASLLTIALGATYRNLRAWLDEGSSDCHYAFDGAADGDDPKLEPGDVLSRSFDGEGIVNLYVNTTPGEVGAINVEAW